MARPVSAAAVRQLYNPNGAVRAMTASAGVLYLGGNFTQLADAAGTSIVPRAHLAAVDLATGLPLAWDPGADGPVFALALRGGKVLAGGDFQYAGGATRTALAELDASPSAGAATAWAPQFGPVPKVRALAAGAATVYVGGVFSQAGGQARTGLAAIDASGSTGWATAFNAALAGGAAVVNALALDGATLYVGGDFSQAGGQARNSLAALDPLNGTALTWAPADGLAAGPVVNALAVSGGRVFVGGSFSGLWGGGAVSDLAALDQGSALSAWVQAGTNGPVRALFAGANGRLLVGGDFGQVNGAPRVRFASVGAVTGVLEGAAIADLNTGLAKVFALGANGNEAILGGTFSSVAGTPVSSAAAVDLGPYTAPTMTSTPTPAPTSTGPIGTGSLYVYPNPMGCPSASRLFLRTAQAAQIRWQLVTPRGSLVAEARQDAPAGANSLPLSCAGLSPGLYLLRVSADFADGSHESYAPYKLAVLP